MITRDGVITDVDCTGAAAPTGVAMHDYGPDSTVMPGLIDAHTHLVFDPDTDPALGLATDSDEVILARIRDNAHRALSAGVTTVRDLGDRGYLTLRVRDDRYSPGKALPHIVAAGPPLTRTGGHCSFLGCEVDDEPAALAAITDHLDRGTDLIKIMATGGMGADPSAAQYDRRTLSAAATAALDLGLPVVAHAHAARTVADAVAAGVTGIEHCTFLTPDGIRRDERTVELMARAEVFVGCTVAKPRPDMPPAVLATLEPYWANHAYMHAHGVPVVCCTDAGIHPAKAHDVLPRDLAYFASQVATTVDTLTSATSLAAAACRLDDRKGRIRRGMDADLLVVSGDPTTDITALTRVKAIYRMGYPIVAGGT